MTWWLIALIAVGIVWLAGIVFAVVLARAAREGDDHQQRQLEDAQNTEMDRLTRPRRRFQPSLKRARR